MTAEVRDPLRRLAVDILTRVEMGEFLNELLSLSEAQIPGGGEGVRRLHFLTTGATKWRLRLDHELDARLTKGLESLPPSVRNTLRLGLFETRFGRAPDHAVINESVEAIRALGFEGLCGLVNGVLRAAAREGEPAPPDNALEALSIRVSHPLWLLQAVEAEYGATAAETMAEWNNQPAPVWVRVDAGRRSPSEVAGRLRAEGLEVEPHPDLSEYLRLPSGTAPGTLEGLREGWLTVQDPSGALATLALGTGSGRILDLCAAPGGKTTHLAERADQGCEIVATDSDTARRGRLEATVDRHGGAGVVVRPYDRVLAEEGAFDSVLIDAPCSNLGVLRRRADARWRITPEAVRELSRIQLELLDRGGELVREGGVLIYSTCTLLRAENGDVVEQFLEGHGAFALEELPEDVPVPFRSEGGMASSLPWRHDIDGAFVARMRKPGPGRWAR